MNASDDSSWGYDRVCEAYAAARQATGVGLVERWAARLPKGAAVLDVGAGTGWPLTAVLVGVGLDVFAIDPSPRMVARLTARFPGLPVRCEAAEESAFFGRRFGGVLMVGVVFLPPREAQPALIARVAGAVAPGGSLLFSAPEEEGDWRDILTGLPSASLGRAGYASALTEAGLRLGATHRDDGGNHYYEAVRPA